MGTQFRVYSMSLIREYWGEDPNDFMVQFHCEIEEVGEPGGEAFAVTVMSPRQLEKELLGTRENELELGRGMLFCTDFNKKAVMARLQKLVDSIRATSWEDLHAGIDRYFDWI